MYIWQSKTLLPGGLTPVWPCWQVTWRETADLQVKHAANAACSSRHAVIVNQMSCCRRCRLTCMQTL